MAGSGSSDAPPAGDSGAAGRAAPARPRSGGAGSGPERGGGVARRRGLGARSGVGGGSGPSPQSGPARPRTTGAAGGHQRPAQRRPGVGAARPGGVGEVWAWGSVGSGDSCRARVGGRWALGGVREKARGGGGRWGLPPPAPCSPRADRVSAGALQGPEHGADRHLQVRLPAFFWGGVLLILPPALHLRPQAGLEPWGEGASLTRSGGAGDLAQWVLVELQGEVEPRQSGELAGSLLGDLHYTHEVRQPTPPYRGTAPAAGILPALILCLLLLSLGHPRAHRGPSHPLREGGAAGEALCSPGEAGSRRTQSRRAARLLHRHRPHQNQAPFQNAPQTHHHQCAQESVRAQAGDCELCCQAALGAAARAQGDPGPALASSLSRTEDSQGHFRVLGPASGYPEPFPGHLCPL